MSKEYRPRIALVGTDSMNGNEIMGVLSRKNFPYKRAEFFDSNIEGEYSKLTQFDGEPKVVNAIDNTFLDRTDLVFLAGDKEVNRKVGNQAKNKKVYAIDLSGSFWEQEEVPVIVSEINDNEIFKNKQFLTANPHPVTIMLSRIVREAGKRFGVIKTVAFILQPVSAFGRSGVEELAGQSAEILNKGSGQKKVFKAQIAFNFLSQLESVDEFGYSGIERRILSEFMRILKNHPLSVSLIQAPVFHGYSLMIYMELGEKADIKSIEETYSKSIFFECHPPSTECPVSPASTAGGDKICIGQIKKDSAFPNSYWIWAAADNLSVGSALNAYEIALLMVSKKKRGT